MNSTRPTGLGEPEISGKKALFRPPPKKDSPEKEPRPKKNSSELHPEELVSDPDKRARPPRRVRTTIDLRREALKIIQDIQQDHRLGTGKALPLWKVVSDAIEYYGRRHKEKR